MVSISITKSECQDAFQKQADAINWYFELASAMERELQEGRFTRIQVQTLPDQTTRPYLEVLCKGDCGSYVPSLDFYQAQTLGEEMVLETGLCVRCCEAEEKRAGCMPWYEETSF